MPASGIPQPATEKTAALVAAQSFTAMENGHETEL